MIPTGKEIYQAVMTMGSYKSLGLDGMSVIFFKRYWAIVGKDVKCKRLPDAFNHTFITLIPKSMNASKVEQYKLISLCNVSLKIINKLIVVRLRRLSGDLIHPSQVGFVPNRAIGDNFIINHEVMHLCIRRSKKLVIWRLRLTSPKYMIMSYGRFSFL